MIATPSPEALQRLAQHYDAQPYTSNAFHQASPAHLRATAYLYGVDTAPLAHARVLELGCAAGGNLLPFALAHPDATVVGVDISPVQIAAGQTAAAELGVRNLTLHALNLAELPPDFGTFDYIICHGVFSWVPPTVRDAILQLCRDRLSANGVAYLSYNTYPGWKTGEIVRAALQYQARDAANDTERLARAKAILPMLAEGLATASPLAPAVARVAKHLQESTDDYLAHEYLSADNTPYYFEAFHDALRAAGLAYVGDADSHLELPSTFGANVEQHQARLAPALDKIERQQYLDFAVNRHFRRSLVVKQERRTEVADLPQLERLHDLRLAAHFREATAPAGQPAGSRVFVDRRRRSLRTSDPAVVAVMTVLSQHWPASAPHAVLKREAAALFATHPDASNRIDQAIITLYTLDRLRLVREAGPYDLPPKDSARHPGLLPGFAYLVREGRRAGIGLANAWHEHLDLRLSPPESWLVQQCGPAIDRHALAAQLREAMFRGDVTDAQGQSLAGRTDLEPLARDTVQRLFDLLDRQGLVVARP